MEWGKIASDLFPSASDPACSLCLPLSSNPLPLLQFSLHGAFYFLPLLCPVWPATPHRFAFEMLTVHGEATGTATHRDSPGKGEGMSPESLFTRDAMKRFL